MGSPSGYRAGARPDVDRRAGADRAGALSRDQQAGYLVTTSSGKYCGRDFAEADIASIRRIIQEDPSRTRRAISLLVCEALSWRKPDAGLKQMSCRVTLLRMQADGLLRLPPARQCNSNGRR